MSRRIGKTLNLTRIVKEHKVDLIQSGESLADLLADLRDGARQEERTPTGWDTGGLFAGLQKRHDRRFFEITGQRIEDVDELDVQQVLNALSHLLKACAIEADLGPSPRQPAKIWVDDPHFYDPVDSHNGSYLASGMRPPIRYRVRSGLKLADNGGLLKH